jgi:hypothetical protein
MRAGRLLWVGAGVGLAALLLDRVLQTWVYSRIGDTGAANGLNAIGARPGEALRPRWLHQMQRSDH